MEKRPRISLAVAVAFYSVLVVALGMVVHWAYQYLEAPQNTFLGLVIQHAWPVSLVGILIYLGLFLVLYRKVVLPVQDITVKLYAITRGSLEPLTVNSSIKEIQDIVECITFLISKMNKASSSVSVSELSNAAQNLRSVAKNSTVLQESEKDTLTDIATKIEEAGRALSKYSLLQ